MSTPLSGFAKGEFEFESGDEMEDDCGVMCRFTDGGWEPIEDHCVNCGFAECECDKCELHFVFYCSVCQRETEHDSNDICLHCETLN